jgi:hypothetical protein
MVNTRHTDMTYKHCLLPIWSAAFVYANKSYRFVVNGRTGQVQGEPLVIAADIVSDIALNNTVHYLLGSVKAFV